MSTNQPPSSIVKWLKKSWYPFCVIKLVFLFIAFGLCHLSYVSMEFSSGKNNNKHQTVWSNHKNITMKSQICVMLYPLQWKRTSTVIFLQLHNENMIQDGIMILLCYLIPLPNNTMKSYFHYVFLKQLNRSIILLCYSSNNTMES